MTPVEIEMLRNKPPGARCNTLVENLMEVVAEIIDDMNLELTIKITFSKEAKALALKINGDVIGEDLTMEEIVEKFFSEVLSEIVLSAVA
ncbi:hypothetical protein DRP07_09035 [Archaeoglobales archaeon]|nr:MAG: hypothetical protein DRP07_09035 [Archaeoglobales archaeon]